MRDWMIALLIMVGIFLAAPWMGCLLDAYGMYVERVVFPDDR